MILHFKSQIKAKVMKKVKMVIVVTIQMRKRTITQFRKKDKNVVYIRLLDIERPYYFKTLK